MGDTKVLDSVLFWPSANTSPWRDAWLIHSLECSGLKHESALVTFSELNYQRGNKVYAEISMLGQPAALARAALASASGYL